MMIPVAPPASPTIFIVDDDIVVCRALARVVRAAGYRVETFSSPHELLSQPRPQRPGCIVLDLLMPGLDGLQAQQAFRDSGLDLPIIFLSGHADVPTSVRALKAGAIDFLVKPVDATDLLRAIEQAIVSDTTSRTEREERIAWRTRYDQLTPREREVCRWVAAGLLNKQIAARLGTAEKTVKIHRGRVMHKLGIRSVAELVRILDRVPIADDNAERESDTPSMPARVGEREEDRTRG
jgi:FixJ family two-component response regulator